MKKKTILIILAILIIMLAGAFLLLIRSSVIKPKASTQGPTLSLSPASATYNLGDTFNVNIILDTMGQAVSGVDIFYLNYDPKTIEGVQIQPGAIFTNYLGNNIDATNGRITISGITNPGAASGYSGSGIFATITFKALALSQNSIVYFTFTPGSTTGCDVAAFNSGSDILQAVNNGSYTFVTATATSTPSPKTTTQTSTNSSSGQTQITSTPKKETSASPTATAKTTSPALSTSTPNLASPIPTASTVPLIAGYRVSGTVGMTALILIPILIVMIIYFIWKLKTYKINQSEDQKNTENPSHWQS